MASNKELGKIFKEAREGRQLTVEEASVQSKMHYKVITDIENGIFDRLGKVYIKSFIKKYSEYLGLNTGDILKIYQLLESQAKNNQTKEKAESFAVGGKDKVPAGASAGINKDLSVKSRDKIKLKLKNVSRVYKLQDLLGVIIPVAVILFLVIFVASLRKPFRSKDSETKTVSEFVEKKKYVKSEHKRRDTTLNLSKSSKSGLIAAGSGNGKGISANTNRSIPGEKINKKTDTPHPVEAPAKELPSPVKGAIATAVPAVKPAQEGLALTLRAQGEVWIQVFDGGKTVYVGTLKRGDEKLLRADKELTVWTGKGEFLEFIVNGNNLGKIVDGVVRNINVSSSGIKVDGKWIKRLSE